MSKIKKIAITLSFLLFIILIMPLTVKAINYKELYDDTSKFFTRNDINIGDPVPWPNTDVHGNTSYNDYQVYVEPYRGIWCLNDKAATNQSNPLILQDIIDIEGTTLKSKKYNKTVDSSSYTDKIIKAAWAFAYEGGKDSKNPWSANTSYLWSELYYNVLTKAVNSRPYDNFLKPNGNYTGSLYSGNHNINDKSMSETEYKNALKDIKLKTGGEGKISQGSYTKDGDKYQYKVTGQSITMNSIDNKLVTSQKITFSGTVGGQKKTGIYKIQKDDDYYYFYNGNGDKVGRIVISTSDIYVKEKNGDNKITTAAYILKNAKDAEIKIEETYKYIHSRMYVLAGNALQTRGICRGEIKSKTINSSFKAKATTTTSNKIDVSMQKYIVELKDENKNTKELVYEDENRKEDVSGVDRENKYAYKNSVKDISKDKSSEETSFYKSENPVKINPGDEVTYNIIVYNNSTTTTTESTGTTTTTPYACGKVLVKDSFDGIDDEKVSIVSIVDESGEEVDNKYSNSGFYYWYANFENSDSKTFKVTIQYNTELGDSSTIYRNHAEIYIDGNATKYRTDDDDFVKLGVDYGISVKKYISETTSGKANAYIPSNEEINKIKEAYNNSDKNKPESLTVENATVIYDEENKKWTITFNESNNTYIATLDENKEIKVSEIVDLAESEEEINKIKEAYNNSDKNNPASLTVDNATVIYDEDNKEWTITFNESNNIYIATLDETGKINTSEISLSKDEVELIYDFNLDGVEDINDAKFLQKYIAKLVTPTDEQIEKINKYGDIDEDEDITILDANALETLVKERLKYDFNLDGVVDEDDAQFLQNYFAKLVSPTDEQKNKIKEYGDVNGDGETNVIDAAALQLMITGLYPGQTDKTDDKDEDTYNEDEDSNENNDETGSEIEEYGNRGDNNRQEKYDNPVIIEKGDDVTYTIKVTNESSIRTKVKVTDMIKFNYDSLETSDWTYKNGSGSLPKLTGAIEGSTADGNGIFGTLEAEGELDSGATATCTVKVRVMQEPKENEIHSNEVEAGIVVNNKVIVKDDDGDYFKEKIYKVSLEKFITKVTGADEENKEFYDDEDGRYQKRSDKRYNIEATSNIPANKNLYKPGNPVQVEPGDIVTYTIRLKNEGDSKVSIGQIYDSFTCYDDKTIKLTQTGLITGNGGGDYDADNTYGDTDNTYDRHLITFNNPTLIAPGEHVDVTIKFKVEIETSVTTTSHTLINTAAIMTDSLKNKNNISVLDGDGTDNNRDSDYVQTKIYKVSLEKFVTQVTDANGENSVIYNDRFGKRYNTEATTNLDTNQNTYKKKNPAQVEPGDIVTYTIRLKNEGDTKVSIGQIYDSFTCYDDKTIKLIQTGSITGNGGGRYETNTYGTTSSTYDRHLITFSNPTLLDPDAYVDVTIKFKVEIVKSKTNESQTLVNTAAIVELQNKNDVDVKDSDGTDNNRDTDYVKTKTYAVSLEKYISKVNNTSITGRDGKAEHNYDDDTSTNNNWKYNNVVTVSQGDEVTYTIKVINNSTDTRVCISEITDYLPDGVRYDGVTYQGNEYNKTTDNKKTFKRTATTVLAPGESTHIFITVKVTEPNISLNILKNTAEITQMKNRNTIEVEDTTPNNNKDADYIQLNYKNDEAIISGFVWNDKALNKGADGYNGVFNDGNENKLPRIDVMLYRNGKGVIATKTTDSNGYYCFKDSDIDATVVTNSRERYIKGPKASTTIDRWAGTYYSYYIIFEYDGITYTSTPDGTTCVSVTDPDAYSNGNYKINSNAKEKKENNEPIQETRQDFNSRFDKINNGNCVKGINEDKYYKIDYSTKNESGYIPQSNHIYDEGTMAMQSSTGLIQLANNTDLQEQIKYVNLGLRGRDVFDLELTSDVAKIDVTVNGQTGTYNYTNKVTVRKSDISVGEDMANFASEAREGDINEVEQDIRKTDLKNDKYDDNQLLQSIEVTYKITVTNASPTDGTVTKIVNYHDNRYTEAIKSYLASGEELETTSESYRGNYKTTLITFPENTNPMLAQRQSIDIYIVYRLNDASIGQLKELKKDESLVTYNMAEVYEYTTQCGGKQTEYTRGLIDKDSAPGSAAKEQVRTKDTEGENTKTTGGDPTTALQYFKKKVDNTIDLSRLKYEDDTYAMPVKFTIIGKLRTLSGTVFEDSTTTDDETQIKTGNGIKDGNDPGIDKIKVSLVEYDDTTRTYKNYRYTVETDTTGVYEFKGFLPGNYVIKYEYGGIEKTFLFRNGVNSNEKSYNGEDFQSTNNTGKIVNAENSDIAKLDSHPKYWYAFNKNIGVSTGTDDTLRREKVSETVAEYNDYKMTVLNNAKAGKSKDDCTVIDNEGNEITASDIANDTYMYSWTPSMILTVEETVVENGEATQRTTFEEYKVTDMNFGIAEIPVTTIDLQKHVSSFTIRDSADDNTIAKVTKGEEGWNVEAGNVLAPPGATTIDVSIEEAKLQGARLEVTYEITADMKVERDFRDGHGIVASIKAITDFIDNDLSYNEALGENSKYWKVGTFAENAPSTIEGAKQYVTVVEAKGDNELLKLEDDGIAKTTITLEKTLSSSDVTIGDIIASAVNSYEYDNNVEIMEINYDNTKTKIGDTTLELKDRIRTPETTDVTTSNMIIIAGIQHDSATSETIVIHPPTGENNNMTYYIIAAISLIILAGGIVLIKKYAIKGKEKK